jgi:hypothetical protein
MKKHRQDKQMVLVERWGVLDFVGPLDNIYKMIEAAKSLASPCDYYEIQYEPSTLNRETGEGCSASLILLGRPLRSNK